MATVPNTAIIIMGASGDLNKRKLTPVLQNLFDSQILDTTSVVIGTGRSTFTDEAFRKHIGIEDKSWREVFFYHRGLNGMKAFLDSKGTFSQYIFFMALPPKVYGSTAEMIYEEGFRKDVKLIIEKPFGYDYQTARALNQQILNFYPEESVYRIDHYLAKEAVQNIMIFRFANSIFYPLWSSRDIDFIEINAFEKIGVEDRGAYFDSSGIIRDMIQNHLIQLLSLITMEPPLTKTGEDILHEKIKILKAFEVVDWNKYQYLNYHNEKGVEPGSLTETFAELKAYIHTYRWSGMPVYIRTGKAVNRAGTDIVIQFKPVPSVLYNSRKNLSPNRIIFRIQPSTAIIIDHMAKLPGTDMITNSHLNFPYKNFGSRIPDAYEKLLLDAFRGEKALFVSAEETELSWQKISAMLETKGPEEIVSYQPGSAPPSQLDHRWVDLDRYKD